MFKDRSTRCETPDSKLNVPRPVTGQTDFAVSLSFPDGELSKPRWSFVRKAVFTYEDLLSLGPTWVMTQPDLPFQLEISLTDSKTEFTGVELFNSTDDKNPVTFEISEGKAVASWPGTREKGLERWVYRLFVSRPGSKTEPVHLTFATQDLDEQEKLLRQLAVPGPKAYGEVKPQADSFVDTTTFATRVEFEPGSVKFIDWFDLKGLALPAGVLLEPQIVVKVLDQFIKFEFDNPQGLFSGTSPTACNPGGDNISPLALLWLGVDPPPLPPCLSPRAFYNSTVRQSERLARVLWNEPKEGEMRRTSSFFFRFVSSNSPDIEMLVDPTIIHDPALPP